MTKRFWLSVAALAIAAAAAAYYQCGDVAAKYRCSQCRGDARRGRVHQVSEKVGTVQELEIICHWSDFPSSLA